MAGPHKELSAALTALKGTAWSLVMMSAMLNVIYLTGSFFMLEIYDRVIPSKSLPTLIGLGIIAAVLYMGQAVLDLIRSRICNRLGDSLDAKLNKRVYDAIIRLPLRLRGNGDSQQSVRDLDQVRSFLSGGGPLAFLDLPFMPLYLAICFLFHVWIGVACLFGMAVLIALAYLAEIKTKAPAKTAFALATPRNALVESGRQNAEVLRAMGMGRVATDRWVIANQAYLLANRQANDAAKGIGAIGKAIRAAIQSAMLAVGAYLVIQGEATGGIIIASSILTARALAPVELSIASWKGLTQARQSWDRLGQLLSFMPPEPEAMALPGPTKRLTLEAASVAAPGGETLVVADVSFCLEAGQGLCIIGPSASGKSSLARMMVGVWRPARGKVRLDGASLEQWPAADLGKYIGYLPQDVQLLAGSVAENISRFEVDRKPGTIIKAAQAAGVHEMILRLPNGYETQIGWGGQALSAGQRQRIGLARALYGEPFLVVLDEPDAHLDSAGDEALVKALMSVRSRGGIAVVIAHRPNALGTASHVLVMQNGRVTNFKARRPALQVVQAAE
jgi:ATP-binding cassette, subfamily C, type I secretion system permease/ATPase